MAFGTRISLIAAAIVLQVHLVGCEGAQSTLNPFGLEAHEARTITLSMSIAVAIITIAVLTIAAHAARTPPRRIDLRRGLQIILWLGAVFPTLFLAVTLVTSLPKMQRPASGADDLNIVVEGEQFWWRIRYVLPDGRTIETANEIRLPVGRTVAFALMSPDVIHSFWIPGLAGKVDMIPGRTNTLVARSTRAGIYRGVCAEFCGPRSGYSMARIPCSSSSSCANSSACRITAKSSLFWAACECGWDFTGAPPSHGVVQ